MALSSIIINKIDITENKTQAIVNAANSSLYEGGGVCGAIFRKAGSQKLTQACQAIGHCKTGSAVITPGFDLCEFIIHAVGPIYVDGNHNEASLLAEAYKAALALCFDNGIHSVTFPLISAGIYNYPKEEAFEIAIRSCTEFLNENQEFDLQVYFAVIDDETYNIGKEVEKIS